MRDFNKHKFDFHTTKCIFIGYNPSYKGYKCLTSSGKIHILRYVIFDENTFPYSTNTVFHSSENNSNSELSVSTFSQQQIYHLSTLALTNSSLEDLQLASSESNEQVPSVSAHTNNLHQQEHSQTTISEHSSSTIPLSPTQ